MQVNKVSVRIDNVLYIYASSVSHQHCKGQNPLHQFPHSKSVESPQQVRNINDKSATSP